MSEKYFNTVAPKWDEMREAFFSEAVREAAIQKAYLHPSMVVADVGGGTGFIARGLAPLVSKVHVVDGSQAMLAEARQNLADFCNVEYHEADGMSLPFPTGSLDAVFTNMYLHHTADPLAAIVEMVRVLRPGGRLVITDLDLHEHEWLRTEMADVWLGFDRQDLRMWFEQAGLVNLLIDGTGEKCTSESETQPGEQTAISIFVATATKKMSMREAVQESYAARAIGGGGCGCSTSSCCSPEVISLEEVSIVNERQETIELKAGYSNQDMADIPVEAAEISLGCGNPTALANLQPGETVLDIGSGGGIDAFLAARQVGPSGKVIGVDMTPAMLQRAQAAADKHGYANVIFRHGYAEKLPVQDSTVDVIISNCVINLAEDKGKVFREAYRVLKPGGRLEVSDIVFGGPVPVDARYSASGWAECISGALPEAEYLDLVKQAGFTDVSVRRSASTGFSDNMPIYSVQVSARR